MLRYFIGIVDLFHKIITSICILQKIFTAPRYLKDKSHHDTNLFTNYATNIHKDIMHKHIILYNHQYEKTQSKCQFLCFMPMRFNRFSFALYTTRFDMPSEIEWWNGRWYCDKHNLQLWLHCFRFEMKTQAMCMLPMVLSIMSFVFSLFSWELYFDR